MIHPPLTVLFVANYPANVGYAWTHIERLFAQVADRLATLGVRTLVAYPAITETPATLDDSSATPIEHPVHLDDRRSVRATASLIRRENVQVLYLTDRPAWHQAYPHLRLAGVRSLVVHDRTSGVRTIPRGVRRMAKSLLVRVPWLVADTVVAVSEYVRQRTLEVGLLPRHRVVTVYNGFPVVRRDGVPMLATSHRALGIDRSRRIVACTCRASREKGVQHLLRAFDVLAREFPHNRRPALVYLGDGPFYPELARIRDGLASRDDILLGGHRSAVMELLRDASLFVVPSVWQDAFPNAVLEPMAWGKPVIASRVGGIPEMIVDGETGLLVPTGDENTLAQAMAALLRDPERAENLGGAARRRVETNFAPETQVQKIAGIVERGLGAS